MIRSIDQGQLSTLLLLNIIKKQAFRVFDYVVNVEMFRNGKVLSDADILFRLGKKIGIAECKSSRSFPVEQIDSMIDVIKKMGFDFGLFSCFLPADSPELIESIEYIRAKNLNFPILIFTREVLFSEEPLRMYRYLGVSADDRYLKGPVLVTSYKRLG